MKNNYHFVSYHMNFVLYPQLDHLRDVIRHFELIQYTIDNHVKKIMSEINVDDEKLNQINNLVYGIEKDMELINNQLIEAHEELLEIIQSLNKG